MSAFISIQKSGEFSVDVYAIVQTFPASGRGLKAFFRRWAVREIQCSSSVTQAHSLVLNRALAW